MIRWWVLIAILVIVCGAFAAVIYRPQLRKGWQEPVRSVQRIASAGEKAGILVEVRDGKVVVDGRPAKTISGGEVITVTIVDGKAYVNGKCVSAGKAEHLLSRPYPGIVRRPLQPERGLPDLRPERPRELVPPAPPWLTEKEKDGVRRDLQRQRAERGLDARRKEMLGELDQIQKRMEKLGTHLKELQERSRLKERPPAPPLRQSEEESAERLERHLEKLLEALERGGEFVSPRVEEFLKRIEKLADEHIEKLLDRYLEKKLRERDDLIEKMLNRYFERMRKEAGPKESPPARRKELPKNF